VDRYEAWIANGNSPNAPTRPPAAEVLTREEIARRKRDEERSVQAQEAMQREVEWRMADEARKRTEERERRVQEEAAWARQSHEMRQRELDEAKRLEAREAAEYERAAARRGYTYSDEERKEEERRRRLLERRREEQEGILRRQQEAEAAARSAMREITASNSASDLSLRRSQEPDIPPKATYPDLSTSYRASTPQSSRLASSSHSRIGYTGPSILPVESPMRYEDDTDTDDRSEEGHGGRKGKYTAHVSAKSSNANLR
jgi:STAM-binding protein